VPIAGQVVKFGDELTQVYGSEAYVLAYLSDTYLFSVAAGQKVDVRVGATRTTGRIETVLGVADALPPEFQNMFRPRDRSRLLRVTLDNPSAIAISQKVRVSSCGIACWADPSFAATMAYVTALVNWIIK
jgi:multidrug resistance efflux pump